MASKEEQLQKEIVNLRAEVQLLRAKLQSSENTIPFTCERRNKSKQVFRFLDLPKEIRLEIYEYLVLPGMVTLRYGDSITDDDERYSKCRERFGSRHGETQVFLVSQQLRDEALPIYLSGNIFICPPDWGSYICASGDLDRTRGFITYGTLANRFLRHLSIAFDLRDYSVHKTALQSVDDMDPSNSQWPHETAEKRLEIQHEFLIEELMESWSELADTLSTHLRLTSLEINFANSYCPIGCCRLLATALDLLSSSEWAHKPKLIAILGVSRKEIGDVEESLTHGYVAETGMVLSFKERENVVRKVKVVSEGETVAQESDTMEEESNE